MRKVFLLSIFTLIVSLLSSPVFSESIATLYSSQGTTEGFFTSSTDWQVVNTGQEFAVADQIRTAENSRAGVKFSDGFLIRLGHETTLTFTSKRKDDARPVSILSGVSHFLSRKSRSFPNISTPHISASVRGTEFVIEVEGDKTTVSVLDGEVYAENTFGAVSISKGEQAIALKGQAPTKQIIINPEDAVQWALYYPPLIEISFFKEEFETSLFANSFIELSSGNVDSARRGFNDASELSHIGRSLSYYFEGNLSSALNELDSASVNLSDKAQLYKASLYLGLGNVTSAENIHNDLGTARENSDKSISSLLAAQKALILLVRNKREEGEKLISPYLTDGASDAVLLVASYLAQSRFSLDDAKVYLDRILLQNSSNEIAKVRMAELYLSSGQEKKALKLLTSDGDVESAYASTVLGFSYLTRKETEKAKTAFESAITKDQALALPRLGLGLTMINAGELERGRTEIEYAVQLDPSIALYRSYLGKAYYEEYSPEKAGKEFDRAIELDPEDPTPYLYRSFLHLTEHRPVKALKDVQTSIEKNDNRAVYRSRLLLDKDEATRTNSLGQIFNRVGFTQLARLEAIKSLNKDYSNYSAHFVLADVYSREHQNSRAQTTENLLGRLLSPVTFNANNINIGGESSINEYTTLFDAPVDRVNLQGRGNTSLRKFGGGIEHISVDQDLGHNFGYAFDHRDGFRNNDVERNHQFFSLGQAKLSADSTLVWDGALTANRSGDLVFNYDPNEENEEVDSDLDSFLIRSGFHHRFDTGLHFIGQVFYNYGYTQLHDRNAPGRFSQFTATNQGQSITRNPFPFDGLVDQSIRRRQNLAQADAQFILDRELVSFVAGSSVRHDTIGGRERGRITSEGSSPELSFVRGFDFKSDATIQQLTHRTYLYSTWHLTDDLDVDLGATYTWLDFSDNALNSPFVDEGYDKDQLSPKAGLMYQITSSTSLRGAYAKTLDRTDRGNIGPLEPTFVGGFNQVFDGIQGSKQEFWAVGIDQSISATDSFVGINYQKRYIDLNNPFVGAGLSFEQPTGELSEDRFTIDTIGRAKEDRIATYLYQILSDEFTFTLDYVWEFFEEGAPLPEIQTNFVKNQLNYFHPSGVFALGQASWRGQERAGAFEPNDKQNFWLFDIGVGYEFDNRRGAVTVLFNNIFDKSFKYSSPRDEQFILPEFNAALSMQYTF